MIFFYYNVAIRIKDATFCFVINSVLSIVINIQNATTLEPVILTGFYTSEIYISPHGIHDTKTKSFQWIEI